MSYILEALKKAESERQLGGTPGLHAAPSHVDTGTARLPRLALAAAVALLAGGAGWFAWLHWPVARPVQKTAVVAQAPAPAPAPAAAPPPVVEGPLFAPAPARPAKPAPKPAPGPVEKPAPEERYPLLAELPEAVARDLPRVTIGGYIYAQNPADSLLLVDKNLRREGEEVAPGLVLEKLLRKSAVMNYRGLRYRVPY